jgi:hypothetical protein
MSRAAFALAALLAFPWAAQAAELLPLERWRSYQGRRPCRSRNR